MHETTVQLNQVSCLNTPGRAVSRGKKKLRQTREKREKETSKGDIKVTEASVSTQGTEVAEASVSTQGTEVPVNAEERQRASWSQT